MIMASSPHLMAPSHSPGPDQHATQYKNSSHVHAGCCEFAAATGAAHSKSNSRPNTCLGMHPHSPHASNQTVCPKLCVCAKLNACPCTQTLNTNGLRSTGVGGSSIHVEEHVPVDPTLCPVVQIPHDDVACTGMTTSTGNLSASPTRAVMFSLRAVAAPLQAF